MAVLIAILSTLSIGTGEFVASDVTKRVRSHEVTAMMFVAGVLLTGAVALFWPGNPTTSDLLYGALGGVLNGVGILLLYAAYSRGSLRSAAPSAAVVMTGVPVIWDIVVGGRSSSIVASLGILLGLVAIVLSSYRPGDLDGAVGEVGPGDPGEDVRGALPVAIAGGVVFGVLLIVLGEIGEGSGGSPLVVQRAVALAVAVIFARATGPRVFPERREDKVTSFVVGIFATTAIVLFLLALQLGGSLSMVSVLSSQYAGVAVGLGVIFRGQKLLPTQTAGLVAASVAVALITLG